jgi:deoxyribonuclease V
MKACVDVHYAGSTAIAACVVFTDWRDSEPHSEHLSRIDGIAPYEPGRFFRRELPCIASVLATLPAPPDLVIIDGYVWLDDARPGLGAHLFDALARTTPVIGVAKTAFRGVTTARAITRGRSASPLFITAAGMSVDDAAECIRKMHGAYRMPTLLSHVDRLSRTGSAAQKSPITARSRS